MRPPINPGWFLARLVAFLVITYLLWEPLAPAYARFLLRASQVGIWLTEFSSQPAFSHQTQLLMNPKVSATGIFFYQSALFPARGLDPQGIPAEWVMANLVLLIPLMLATPATSWRSRLIKLAIAIGIAVVFQVADIVIGIKSFYSANFPGIWSPFATKVYQFLDAFVQSWDTQLFPFLIWAGVNFRQILPERLFTPPAAPASPSSSARPSAPALPRAERRRRDKAGG